MRFLDSCIPSIVVTYWNPASVNFVASSAVVAPVHVHSSSLSARAIKYTKRHTLSRSVRMSASRKSEPPIVTNAIIISLVAGILILLGAFYGDSFYTIIDWGRMPIAVVTGILVLIAAVMLRIRPGESTQGLRKCCLMWGGLIMVLSIISLITGSVVGFIGSIVGIIGAALAMVAKV